MPHLTATARIGADPPASVAIEDSVAGMRTIALTTTSPRQALAGADLVVDSLAALTPDVVAALGLLTD
jgi:beta-phosphoglucomutase-like phosphatase (HAD superfamily)